jgi:hypothetical protein
MEPDGESTEPRDWPQGEQDRPREQWMGVNAPEWRIVSEDLWKGRTPELRRTSGSAPSG